MTHSPTYHNKYVVKNLADIVQDLTGVFNEPVKRHIDAKTRHILKEEHFFLDGSIKTDIYEKGVLHSSIGRTNEGVAFKGYYTLDKNNNIIAEEITYQNKDTETIQYINEKPATATGIYKGRAFTCLYKYNIDGQLFEKILTFDDKTSISYRYQNNLCIKAIGADQNGLLFSADYCYADNALSLICTQFMNGDKIDYVYQKGLLRSYNARLALGRSYQGVFEYDENDTVLSENITFQDKTFIKYAYKDALRSSLQGVLMTQRKGGIFPIAVEGRISYKSRRDGILATHLLQFQDNFAERHIYLNGVPAQESYIFKNENYLIYNTYADQQKIESYIQIDNFTYTCRYQYINNTLAYIKELYSTGQKVLSYIRNGFCYKKTGTDSTGLNFESRIQYDKNNPALKKEYIAYKNRKPQVLTYENERLLSIESAPTPLDNIFDFLKDIYTGRLTIFPSIEQQITQSALFQQTRQRLLNAQEIRRQQKRTPIATQLMLCLPDFMFISDETNHPYKELWAKEQNIPQTQEKPIFIQHKTEPITWKDLFQKLRSLSKED